MFYNSALRLEAIEGVGIKVINNEICVREWKLKDDKILCFFEDKNEYTIKTDEIEKLEKWMKIKTK